MPSIFNNLVNKTFSFQPECTFRIISGWSTNHVRYFVPPAHYLGVGNSNKCSPSKEARMVTYNFEELELFASLAALARSSRQGEQIRPNIYTLKYA